MPQPQHPIEKFFQPVSRYHYYVLGIMFLTKIPVHWHLISLIFLSPPMEYECKDSGRADVAECPCNNPSWDRSVFSETVQTKYNLLCERKWIVSLSESIIYVGTLIGALVVGFLADRFGRLFMYAICCLWLAITGCIVSFMPTSALFIIMRCLEGIGVGGAVVTGFVFIVEYCATRYRDTVAGLYHIPLTIGHTSLAGVSYFIRHVDIFQLALSLPLFVVALSWCLLHESPKWLMDKGRIDKAAKALKKIAKFNNTKISDAIETEMQEYVASRTSSAKPAKVSFFEIFKYKQLRTNFLSMAAIYLICGMGYYGVSQYIGRMKGNIHRNVAISGLFLIPGTIASIFLLKLLSRRLFLMLTNIISGVLMIVVIFMPADMKTIRMVIASISNTFFFMSFIIIFLYGVELFPTGVRNSVLGVLSVLSRTGMIIAPPINALNPTVAGAVFGIAAIFGAVLCYPLPETKNVELPSTMEDSRALRHATIVDKKNTSA